MGKTKIEWCDYTTNPVKGKCPMACSYCYARRLYDRFKWDSMIRLDLDAFQPLRMVKEPSRVFVGSTIELFGDWIPREWLMDIFSLCDSYKRAGHQFLFLTKLPQNLIWWSPFPDNVWVGITATNNISFHQALFYLEIAKSPVRFVSLEPFLGGIPINEGKVERMKLALDWLIIGQQTPVTRQTQPKLEWLREIVEAADKVGIPVFLKDNLDSLLRNSDMQIPTGLCDNYGRTLRQELPNESKVMAHLGYFEQ